MKVYKTQKEIDPGVLALLLKAQDESLNSSKKQIADTLLQQDKFGGEFGTYCRLVDDENANKVLYCNIITTFLYINDYLAFNLKGAFFFDTAEEYEKDRRESLNKSLELFGYANDLKGRKL